MVNLLVTSLPISTFQTALSATVGDTSTAAKLIQDYGVTTVLCAVMIIFAIAMFNSIIRRNNTTDDTVVKLLNEILATVNTVKNSDVDVAGSFDKHNTKFVIEAENLKNGIKAIDDKIDDLTHDDLNALRQILTIIDQECSDIRDSVVILQEITKDTKGIVLDIRRKVDSTS